MRGTATDKLADVIQMLLMVQKTGILTVQRETTVNSLEEGSLFLRDGQIEDALVGNLRGADALKKFSTWTRCYFVFQALPPSASSPFPPYVAPYAAQPDPGPRPAQPSFYTIMPSRTEQYQQRLPDFDRLGLSRTHRQLFMLSDGQRSLEALAKLLGRHPQEVLHMLNDLENLRLLHHL